MKRRFRGKSIEGLELGMAEKYVKLRHEIDRTLFEIESLGEVIKALCLDDVEIDTHYIGYIAGIIKRDANEVWGRLDEFLQPYYIESDLEGGMG